jgi:mono/diheme cytochrome c family protein
MARAAAVRWLLFSLAAAPAAAAELYGLAERGSADYATYCAPCHGARGGGDGPLAAMLAPRPARHTNGAYMNALSDEHLLRLLREGGPAVGKSPLMGAWGRTLSDQRICDLVAFMRTLAEPTERAAPEPLRPCTPGNTPRRRPLASLPGAP